MADPRVLGIVLAGGEGKRLSPLTLDRAKPAVPFGGLYRLIDFALSNVCCIHRIFAAFRAANSAGSGATSHKLLHEPWTFSVA